jgi:hypothetical protein
MKIRIQAIDAENGDGEKVEDIVQLERGALRPEELGLTLTEAKAILRGMQQSLVTEQVAAYVGQFKSCPQCGAHLLLQTRVQVLNDATVTFGRQNKWTPGSRERNKPGVTP